MGACIVPGVLERGARQMLSRMSPDMPVDVPVSDRGIDGARPLGPPEWDLPGLLVSDLEWTTQNRRINDVIAGRA